MMGLIANWKLLAIVSAVVAVSSFSAGWYACSKVAEAAENKKKVQAQEAKTDKEQKGNERLSDVEKKNARVRELERELSALLGKNRGANGNRNQCVASPDGVRGINAIRRASDTR